MNDSIVFMDSNVLLYAFDKDMKRKVLYSEDMQNGQEIDNKLLIINPFEA